VRCFSNEYPGYNQFKFIFVLRKFLMFYGFSVLLFMLSLATGIPAIPQLLRKRKIKQNSAITTGLATLNTGPSGGLMSSILGKVNYPQIFYRTPDQKEWTIEVIDSSPFNFHRYKTGDTVEVVYDKSAPWMAYVQKEWDNALRDLWMAGGEILVAAVLWYIGRALNLPM
jgi:hypothetical protein